MYRMYLFMGSSLQAPLFFALEYGDVVPIKPLGGDNPIKTISMYQKKFSMVSVRVAWLGTDTCLCLGRSSKAYMQKWQVAMFIHKDDLVHAQTYSIESFASWALRSMTWEDHLSMKKKSVLPPQSSDQVALASQTKAPLVGQMFW